tara:strand:+ start:179 stop:1051 length:873 start_codon:yes stop_codon:yes gene_type:complete
MISKNIIIKVEELLNKKIIDSKLLSSSFGINCIKLTTSNKNNYIVKYYREKNYKFNAIKSEARNLTLLNDLNIKIFPKVFSFDENLLIISFIDNNGVQPNEAKKDLLEAITSLHKIKNNHFGFDFNTQIGGLEQINNISNNWVEFYRDLRLGYIFEKINSSNSMDNSINKKIELLLKEMENFIPKNPEKSFLHGDLWEGNILFKNNQFVGFIDPGSFYGHNELEIAYLRWFYPNFIGKNFLEKYNDFIKIDKEYKNYEYIYQLYYSLLNVYLWDRIYVEDVKRLLIKIKI